MAAIAILPDDLVDQIAAGEVVERPASVAKELIENALDAGATTIVVEVDAGGVALLRVTDDGHGMSPADARLSVKRHATSKIRAIDDLGRLSTLGFRGEALPSIASVSRFTLRTRERSTEAAFELRIDGGTTVGEHEVGAAPGTSVEVRDLFFNVPARKKFLKSTATEAAQIGDVCLRAALSEPRLRLTLVRDGKRVRELLPCAEATERAKMLFPDDGLSAIEGERASVKVRAMLSPPERARSGATQLHVVVNGRPVRDRALARAIAFGYGSLLSGGRYPVGVVWLTLDPARVDVNVHPQKAEVRFEDARDVLDAITRVVAIGLGQRAFASGSPSAAHDSSAAHVGAPAALTRDPSFWESRLGGAIGSGASDAVPFDGAVPYPSVAATSPERAQRWNDAEAQAPFPDASTPKGWRFLAQAKKTFLLCEGPSGLVVLDQHAADERVRFDSLRRAYAARSVPMQRLLLPERVELPAADVALVTEHEAALAAMGLEVAALGETTLSVRAVPALVSRASPTSLIRDLCAELTRDGSRAFGDRVDRALATMACHGSIRAGDDVSPTEAAALLRALDGIEDFATHCPHGRPIVYEIGWAELMRKVGR